MDLVSLALVSLSSCIIVSPPEPAPAAAEPIPTDSDGVVSTGRLWALVGSNGEIRELWRGPPEKIDPRGGLPEVLQVSMFGEVREGEVWRDLRALGWTDAGSWPGGIRLRSADRSAGFIVRARRGGAEAPIVLRWSFPSARSLRFQIRLLSKTAEVHQAPGGAAVILRDGPGRGLTLASTPAGKASVSGDSAAIEIPPALDVVVAIFPVDGIAPEALEGRIQSEAAKAAAIDRFPPGVATVETGVPDLDDLIGASAWAIEANGFDSGVIVAGSDGWYKNVWIRDGTYSVLGADILGNHDLAGRFFRFWIREGSFSWGGENEAQQPAIGILGMRTHALLLPPKEAGAFLREVYPYVKSYGGYYADRVEREGMLGAAEEWICQVPAPCSWPNAEVFAGLEAAAWIAGRVEDPAGAGRFRAAAARLKEKILSQAYDPEKKRFIPLAGPPGAVRKAKDGESPWQSGPLRDDRVDSGMLMLARSEIFGRGLGAVAVDDPRFAATQAWIHKVLYQADRSISRFDGNPNSPHYPGGEWPMWPISAAWAAQIEHLRGRADRAWDHLLSGIVRKSGVDHAGALRQLPEQWRHDGRPVRTTRFLTWSHGELLTTTAFLLLGLDLEPEGADLGLAPSLPPGSAGASVRGLSFRGWSLDISIGSGGSKIAGRRGPEGPERLRIAAASGVKELADGGTLEIPRSPSRGRAANAAERSKLFWEILHGAEPPGWAEGAAPELYEALIRKAEEAFDREKLRAERLRRDAELARALGSPFESTAGPIRPEGLRVSTIFTAQEMAGRLAGEKGREDAVEWCRRHGLDRAFVESFRDGYEAKEETLVAVRNRFRAAGLAVSGCVTPTRIGKLSTGWKDISCYTAARTREMLPGIFSRAAKLFDEIMIDDFLFTDCTCEECQQAKGSESWSSYRLRLMREVSARDILAPVRAVRPGVRVILKYPQWYDDFHNRGYDVLSETAMYPAIWVGTETRDPENRHWGRKAQYEAYFIMRWLGGIGGGKTGGGWFDPYGTSPATYVEQARQTVLGGAREMLLFCHDSLVQPQNRACPEALIPELPSLRDLAMRIRGLPIRGVAAPKPPQSQPAKGEEYLFDFVGMLGIPLVPCTSAPGDAPALLITSHSARDPSVGEWLRRDPSRPVLVTPEAEKALPGDLLAAVTRPVARISWKDDPREIMGFPREELGKIRAELLKTLGVRLEAPGRVALYLYEDPKDRKLTFIAIENFNDSPAEVIFGAPSISARWEGAIVLPPSRSGEVRREAKDGADSITLPPRTLVAFGASAGAEGATRDAYGGATSIRGKKTGFFHVEKLDGRFWIITPEGNGFLSKGINHLNYMGDQGRKTGRREYHENVSKKYGSEEAFHRAALERLKGWGFNTLGAWCNVGAERLRILSSTKILNLLAATTPDAWLKGNTADVFSEEFEKAVRARAEREAKPLASDPWLLGYYSDNELSFGPDWRVKTTLLERMLDLPEGAPGRRAAEKALAEHGGDRGKAAPPFAGTYARRYFEVCREAIRAADPNHMILGARFAGPPAPEVAEAAAGLVDVFSVNIYSKEPDLEKVERLAAASRAPVLIGEFAFRGRDSGLPNTRGAGPVVETQADRADAFARYVEKLLSSPVTVGYHWFEHQDEPAEGRFDGEDSNYGLVDIQDRPYEVLVARMAQVNARAEETARGAKAGGPLGGSSR